VAHALVSGARGGIGAAAVAELASSHEVIAQDIRAPGEGAHAAREWIVGDLLDADVLAQI
jgi:nucleoside-diphosphate-sugar epimerase